MIDNGRLRLGCKQNGTAGRMGILTRHLASESLKVLVLALLTLTVMLSVGMAAKEAVRQGMPPGVVLRAMPYFIVEMLGYSLPASVLYVVCTVFGRMANDNELIAIKGLGIAPGRLVTPVLAAAFLISLGTVVTYDITAVWGRPGVRRLMAESAAEMAVGVLHNQNAISLPWGSISVRRVHEGQLVQPTIRMKAQDDEPETLLEAEEGGMESDARGVRLVLFDAEASVGGSTVVLHPGRLEIELPVGERGRPVHRDWLAQSEIPNELAAVRRQLAARVPAKDGREVSKEDKETLERLERKARRLEAEPYRRWANGFSCLSFALVGIPLAMRMRNSDAISTFFVAFLPILVVYYPLLMLSEMLALSGDLPPWAFWLGDLILSTAGLAMLWRVVRR